MLEILNILVRKQAKANEISITIRDLKTRFLIYSHIKKPDGLV